MLQHYPPGECREQGSLCTGSHHSLVGDAPRQERSNLPEEVLWLRDVATAFGSTLQHSEIARVKGMGSGVLLNV